MIKVITGVRRCGKSSLMQMVSQKLMDSGIAAENIIVLILDQRPYRRIHDADQLEDLIVSKSKRVLKGGKKYYLSDLGFYFALRTDNQINYGPMLENIVYNYCAAKGCEISVGKIGNLEIDFILKNNEQDYAYVQVARTIDNDRYDEHGLNITKERAYRPLEKIKDGYPKILLTMDRLLQKRNGIQHYHLVDLMADNTDLC